MKEKLYLIKQRGFYWKPDSAGYTDKISLAGLYPEKQAISIVNNRREPPDVRVEFNEDLIQELKGELEEAEKIVKSAKDKLERLEL